MPSGTVTFLFTDIEASTRLLERLRARYAEILADQRKLLRAAFANWHGREVDTQGDSFFVAFPSAADALRSAVEAQHALAAWPWPEGVEVRVRMGVHTGEPFLAGGGYVGIDVHRAARIAAAGHGGQILVSGTTRDLVVDELPPKTELRDLGTHKLKDLRGETRLYEVVAEGLRSEFPPPVTVTADEPPPTPGEAPYRGLQAFEEDDAALFFGREEVVARLVDQVTRRRFLALIGASGSGKSSILRAGLVPAMRAARPAWRILLLTPTAHPLEALAASLAPDATPRQLAALVDDLRGDPRSLALAVRARRGRPETRRVLIAIDQLEEVFTLCRDEDERGAFLANLIHACGLDEAPATSVPEADRATVVITLRADFYAFLAPYPPLRDASAASQLYVGAMSADELRQAIEEPGRRSDWDFVPGLVDLLLRDVGDEPGALPLLSHALLETWRRRRGTTMTLRSYAESGGVKGAIARTADRVYEGELTAEQRPTARNIFVRLTELGEGTQDTRRRARLAELLPADPARAADVRALIGALADARLVTVAEDDVQVAHEALIREWPTLREWLRSDREGLRTHRRLTEAAGEWELAAFEEGLLYREGRLAQARDWASSNPTLLNDLERRFLDASVARAEREEAERESHRRRELESARALARGLRQRALLLGGGLLVAAVLAGVSVLLARQSDQNAGLAADRAAEARANAAQASDNAGLADKAAKDARANLDVATSQRLGTQADTLFLSGQNDELPALLALTGLRAHYTPEADEALQRVAHRYFGERLFPGPGSDLAASPDGKTLFVSRGDRIFLWDVPSGRQADIIDASGFPGPERRPSPEPPGLALSKDGTVLMATSAETYRMGSRVARAGVLVPQAVPIYPCDFNDGIVIGIPVARALSPDGRTMATALQEGGIVLEPVGECQRPRTRFDGRVSSAGTDTLLPARSLAFSPDSTLLAGITGPRITVWDVASGEVRLSFRCGPVGCRTVGYSPDGRMILTAGLDATARLYDAQGDLIRAFSGHERPLTDARFSPDGRLILTGSQDATARLWDAGTGKELQRYIGHTGEVTAVAFSGDGKSVFTASVYDGSVRRWLIDPPPDPWAFSVGADEVHGLAFSADGTLLASASLDRIEVRDLVSGAVRLDIPSVGDDRVAFSPDGGRLLVASGGGASMWDVASGRKRFDLGVTAVGPNPPGTAAFGPGGLQVLATSGDGGLGLWDAATGHLVRLYPAVGDATAAFSADGSTVAYQTPACGFIDIVDAATGAIRGFVHGGECVTDLALTPDGSRLVTSDYGNPPRLWDVSHGTVIRTLPHRRALVNQVRVTADGRDVLTGGDDGTARLFELDTGRLIRVFRGSGNGSVTAVALSPDGKFAAIGGLDGSVALGPVAIEDLETAVCTRLLRDLAPYERDDYSIEGTTATCP